MIRVVQKADITKVADIWLDTNIKAHNFISAQYWESNYEMVKEMLLQAEVYVCESNGEIQGFIGLNGDYIEGIFVCDRLQSQGIGKLLLNFEKESRTQLSLNVYQKNTRAIHFYQREGFEIQNEGLDEATGEKDYVMTCIFPIMYSEINILMLNVNFVQDSRCILHNGKYDFAGDRAWNCFEYSFKGLRNI